MTNSPMPEPLFSSPQRQSPAALFIILAKTTTMLAKIFWPALLVFLFRSTDKPKEHSNKGDVYIYILLAAAVVTLIATIINYLFHRFYIAEGHFIIKSGWLNKKVTSIPLQNITAVHLEQHVLHRIFNVAKVSLDSAGSDKVEVSIDALSLKKADELKQFLLQNSKQSNKDEAIHVEDILQHTATVNQSKLSFKELLVLSLTANHIEAFFILLALSVNVWDDLRKVFKLNESQWIDEHATLLKNSVALAAGLMFLVAIASVLYSFIRTVLRFFDFTITTESNGWKMAYGLTNHQQVFLPFSKVQIMQWSSNFIRRKFNIWIMHFMSAGYSEVRKKQKVHIPVLSSAQISNLVLQYQQTPIFAPQTGQQIHRSYWIRGVIYVGFILGLIPGIAAFFWIKSLAIGWVMVMAYIVVHRFCFYRHFRWQTNEEGLQMYSGAWGRKFTLLRWNKIQQVHLSQNLFQKSRAVASLHFITAGGEVELPYIPLQTARMLVDQSLYFVESKDEKWM